MQYYLINKTDSVPFSWGKNSAGKIVCADGMPVTIKVIDETTVKLYLNNGKKFRIESIVMDRVLTDKSYNTPFGKVHLPIIRDISTSSGSRFLFIPLGSL